MKRVINLHFSHDREELFFWYGYEASLYQRLIFAWAIIRGHDEDRALKIQTFGGDVTRIEGDIKYKV